MEAAKAASKLIKAGQTIGVGAGSTIAKLIRLIAAECTFSSTLTLVSSSFNSSALILKSGLNLKSAAAVDMLDIYFDGCDQFDTELSALKSGGGIHTTEKILASMADEFILIGDTGKFADQLNNIYPLVIEVIPAALNTILQQITASFPDAELRLRMSTEKDGAVISEYGNYLIDIYFSQPVKPAELNVKIKMIPGIVEHSLFYRMATKAIVAGEEGIKILRPQYS
ncbi:ribose-5-phosphate isomerase [Pedobacter hartonius]|uniref:Ribose 5-phosphate isomerase A n=2 Tax=Pedobacter hartonius TaxID=425514 RepID=A0A1H4GB59_9SPHI|nr:ribose-5-phosphate isomerase [Pedobacter hartonius]